MAGSAEVEFHREGDTILSQGAEPVHHVRIVRSGAVEVISDGLLLDLLGPGELFGHGSMLSGLPAGFTARAHEDTLTYRIAEDVAVPVLARPETVTFVARSLLTEPRPPFGDEETEPPMRHSATPRISRSPCCCAASPSSSTPRPRSATRRG